MATKNNDKWVYTAVRAYRMKHIGGMSRDAIAKELGISTRRVTHYTNRGADILGDLFKSTMWKVSDEAVEKAFDALVKQLDHEDPQVVSKAIKRIVKYFGASALAQAKPEATQQDDYPTG